MWAVQPVSRNGAAPLDVSHIPRWSLWAFLPDATEEWQSSDGPPFSACKWHVQLAADSLRCCWTCGQICTAAQKTPFISLCSVNILKLPVSMQIKAQLHKPALSRSDVFNGIMLRSSETLTLLQPQTQWIPGQLNAVCCRGETYWQKIRF